MVSTFNEINLTVNLFVCATVTYPSKIVGCGKVCPVETKVEAIVRFCVPASRRELKRFLGLAGYYQSFCLNLAIIAAPLTNMLSLISKSHLGLLWMPVMLEQSSSQKIVQT